MSSTAPIEERQRIVVQIHNRPEAAERVLSVLRRRGFQIALFTLYPAAPHGLSRIMLVLTGGREVADRAEVYLRRIVTVVSIEHRTLPTAEQPKHERRRRPIILAG